MEIRGPEVVVTAEPIPAELEGARWEELPLHYCIVDDGTGFVRVDEFASLAAAAFAEWGVEAVHDGICRDGITRANGVNEIGWGRPPEAQGGAEEAGFTRIIFRQCSRGCTGGAQNRIVEADIIIADDPPDRWRNARCLYSTMLHEVGHFIGVPHLDSPALMAPASANCPQDLTEMDRAVFDRLYSSH
nr:J528 [uncultured bacterium]